jgi:hypothetical protein
MSTVGSHYEKTGDDTGGWEYWSVYSSEL